MCARDWHCTVLQSSKALAALESETKELKVKMYDLTTENVRELCFSMVTVVVRLHTPLPFLATRPIDSVAHMHARRVLIGPPPVFATIAAQVSGDQHEACGAGDGAARLRVPASGEVRLVGAACPR